MDNGESSYRRFLSGDKNAFDDVLNIYKNSLIFFINRYVSDISAAEDIAIDAFMELIVHPHRYNFKVSLKTYLFTIGRRRAIDWLRKNRRTQSLEISQLDGEAQEIYGADCADSDRERREALEKALETLPQDMRTAVHLVYYEDMSYDEAAKIMKIKRKQVDNLLYKAKVKLKAAIERGNGE